MKIGFSLTIVPEVAYHIEECRACPEMVMIDIPEDNLPNILLGSHKTGLGFSIEFGHHAYSFWRAIIW